VVEAVLNDWRTSPVDQKQQATLGLLEKLVLAPADIGPDDIVPLRAAGVSQQAIEDAPYVCMLFTIINRIADSLDFELSLAEAFARDADRLLEHGYL
jgi:alkylhydroperoxidase family enzyme